MKRIRINNDFTFAWAIERNGLPEDLSTAINMVLQARNSAGTLQTITDYDVAGNIVSVEVTTVPPRDRHAEPGRTGATERAGQKKAQPVAEQDQPRAKSALATIAGGFNG